MWLLKVIVLSILCMLCHCTHDPDTENVIHIGMLVSHANTSFGRRLVSAFMVGLENVKSLGILRGYDFQFKIGESLCNGRLGVKKTIEIWRALGSIDGIIGDTCSVSCQPVALIAATWNIPMVSNLCTSDALSDSKSFPTFTRVVGVYKTYADIISGVLRAFNWTTVGIITDTADLFTDLAIGTRKLLLNQGVTVHYYAISASVNGDDSIIEANIQALRGAMRQLKQKARIIYIMRYAKDTRNAMVTAYEEGMYNGEFVFLGLESLPFIVAENAYRPDIPHNELWQGYLSIQQRFIMSDRFEEFKKNASVIAGTLPKDPGGPILGTQDYKHYSALMYDAVLAWAWGVNKTVTEGYGYNDGLKVTSNIYNMTFQGMTGAVVIDPVGDRKYDYEIWSFQNMTNVPILLWKASEGKMYKLYKPDDEGDWSGLFWFGNGTTLPLDSPLCGWRNEFCAVGDGPGAIIGGGVTFGVFALFACVITITVRHVRKKSKLKEAAAYIVPWESIQLMSSKALGASFAGSRLSMGSENVGYAIELAKCLNHLGVIKRVGPRSLSATNDTLLNELRILKSIKHDNLNAVIAVCLEAPNACILTQFAQRGSFQDVISNDTVTLTWDFKSSLLLDVANGMAYLHSTEIGFHGRLTSSNCVIDNRWMGKITDYGLRYMKEESEVDGGKELPANKLLWTAPEILQTPRHPGSKEGDVYSYAIIAQEVILLDTPFCDNKPTMEAEEIVKRVAAKETPAFRPVIKQDESITNEWLKLIETCWADNPSARPTFQKIKNTIKEMNKGRETNLVQIIINRLEVHTRHLEQIVAERSRDLLEEKAKMETLLQELIPKSISRLIMSGRSVEPETFSSVTIFFSDVCGFTRISAAGTPHDVVRMLNGMYTMFDNISAKFDVYKVATIGDAYFVASGVPLRNGSRHAAEICGMALQLLISVQNFPIEHLQPVETLRLRIGVHSGPVVAGVAGQKMPRYMLFGDTVDNASKMESGGENMAIHISQVTYDLLQKEGNFTVKERGITDIKGLENTMTYLLLSGKAFT